MPTDATPRAAPDGPATDPRFGPKSSRASILPCIKNDAFGVPLPDLPKSPERHTVAAVLDVNWH
jgi:hypothetical protein